MSPLEAALQTAFGRFAEAVERGDLDAFRALCAADAPSQDSVFLRNAEKVRAGGFRLKLCELLLEGEVGEARFELVDRAGAALDAGAAAFTLEGGSWKLRAL